MKGIDPKYIMWLGLAVGVEQAIGHGTVSLTNIVPADWAPYVTSWCNLLAFIGTSIMTYQAAVSGPQTGPLVNPPGPSNVVSIDSNKIVRILLLAFLPLALLAGGEAKAQGRRPAVTGNIAADIKTDMAGGVAPGAPGQLITGNPEKDMQALWKKIVGASISDLNYAAAMAQNANTTTSTVRLQCLKAIITLNQQASGANLKNPDGTPMTKPDPSLFSDVEGLAEIVDNLSPQGPLFVNCAGAAQLAKTNVLTFVNAVVTGAAGFAAMPVIPGL